MCLQVVAECGIVASTGIRLPFCHNARRVCAEETSFFSVHAANEGADAEGTTTTALGISTDRSEHILSLLLLASDVVRYILYGGDFVVGHAVALRFHTGLGVISSRDGTMSTSFLASALKPAKQNVMFSSICISFFTERGSWS